jgi:Flp pilus assembly protein TadD
LPGIRIGSVVTETITTKTTRPFFRGGSAFQIAFQSNVPRDSVELVVDLPESLPFNHEILDVRVSQTESKQNGRRRVVFRGGPYPAIEGIDYYAPSTLPAWPSVGFSTATSWQEIARAYAEVVEGKLDITSLEALARRTVGPDDGPREKADKLLAALRERVRYAAVEFGETAIIPAKPAQTFERAYGDCKDQSLALTGLLRAAGVHATLALLRTGPGQDVRPRLPSLDVFDHAIVVIPGKTPIWIDPTVPYARAGELPGADQGRLALIVDPATTELTATPIGTAKENTYREVREVQLSDLGPARVRETSTASGLPEQRLRSTFSESKEAMTKSLTDYVKKVYDADKLASWKTGDPERLTSRFELNIDVQGARAGYTDLTTASVRVDYGVLDSWLPGVVFDEEPRPYDLVLPFVYEAEVRYRIVPPKNFLVHRMPAVKNLTLGPATLSRSYQKNADGSVDARFVFTVEKQRLTSADLESFRKARALYDAEDVELVEFEHEGQQAIEARQSVKGMEIFRKLAEADPKSSTALLRWAANLVDMGFGKMAREKARSAVALAPDNAVAHRTLGIILERDEFGRHLHAGYDREGARAAYRKAAELDPSDVFSKVEAALLLEYDLQGGRYGRDAELDRAVTEYDAIPTKELAEYEEGVYQDSALFCLFYRERFDELRRRLAERKPANTPASLAIGAAAGSSGIVAANAEADRLGLRGEERSDALAGAGASLYLLARYSEAALLFDLAAKESKKAAEYANQAQLLRGVTRVDPAKLPENTPEAVVKKAIVLSLASAKGDPKAAGSLVSPRATGMLDLSALAPPRLNNDLALPRAVLVDMTAGIIKTSTDGNDATGHRVQLSMQAPGRRTSALTYYVVREGGRYQVRSAGDRYELGCEALHLVSQKKEKPARQWLTWAADGMDSGSGSDPLDAPPFVRLWSGGKGHLELSAAALCASGSNDERALAILAAARPSTDAEMEAVDQVLIRAKPSAKDDRRALEGLSRLERAHPKSKTLRDIKLYRLWSLERFVEYEKAVGQALAELKSPGPERARMLSALADAQARLGKIKESRATYQTIIDERQATSGTYNGAAWNGLFVKPRPNDVLAHALQAAQMSSFKSYSELHTLATVYVELGKIEEARQTLAQLLELPRSETPPETAWYVIGALAEAYGLTDVAGDAYRKLRAPEKHSHISTYLLAKRRLEALGKKTPNAR